MVNKLLTLLLIASFGLASNTFGAESKLKDLINIKGVRNNHLLGLGVVVGLKGTGDTKKSLATNKATANMLTKMGILTTSDEVVAGNVAAVMVTGELPTFARIGDKLDVKISAVGDASSLAGGTLIMTPLRAGNSVYAVAQGAVAVGQANGAGPQVLTVARVPAGAIVEKEFAPEIAPANVVTLSLKQPDFTTALRVEDSINTRFNGFYAKAVDLSTIRVDVPPLYVTKIVEFVARLESLKVQPDSKARVVINERTGTVVMGQAVMIDAVAIAHGDLSIQIGNKTDKNNPPDGVVNIGGASVGDLVKTLNAMGVRPADLVGIIQAVHASGALRADLSFL